MLPDDLGREETLRLVGHGVVAEQRGAFRDVLLQLFGELFAKEQKKTRSPADEDPTQPTHQRMNKKRKQKNIGETQEKGPGKCGGQLECQSVSRETAKQRQQTKCGRITRERLHAGFTPGFGSAWKVVGRLVSFRLDLSDAPVCRLGKLD